MAAAILLCPKLVNSSGSDSFHKKKLQKKTCLKKCKKKENLLIPFCLDQNTQKATENYMVVSKYINTMKIQHSTHVKSTKYSLPYNTELDLYQYINIGHRLIYQYMTQISISIQDLDQYTNIGPRLVYQCSNYIGVPIQDRGQMPKT